MGWLFGKKKSKVPFPEPRTLSEGALHFPTRSSTDRVFEPEQLKMAAGIDQSAPTKSGKEPLSYPLPEPKPFPRSIDVAPAIPKNSPVAQSDEPLFVHIDVYRQVLGTIDDIKRGVNVLQETTKHLETSEYNEEANFTKLKRSVKTMHDRILQMDKVVFKSQGM